MSLKKIETSITSREIAKMTNREHKEAMRDIRNMEPSWEKVTGGKFPLSEYKDKSGRKLPEYKFNKSQALYVVSKYNNEVRALIISRLDYLETQFKERQHSRLEYAPMTDAIKAHILEQGKDPKFYHFTNEANLVNRIVLGCTASKWREDNDLTKDEGIRDTLGATVIKAITNIQRNNTALIELGFDFEDRKKRLTELFNKKYKDAMLEELERLEA